LNAILNREFQPNGVEAMAGTNLLLGSEHMLAEKDGALHSFYRPLVGSAITPSACNAAVPNLQALAEKQAGKMSNSGGNIIMRDICGEFTLDVAWRQILGLNLSGDEVEHFYGMVDKWVKGIISLCIAFHIFPKQTEGFKARAYIVKKLEEKIDDLLANGPDDTTMSGMVFATDEDNTSLKLTRSQIIDNALLLILAGSKTSASTLVNTMLCLGLNRDKWEKLVEEQQMVQSKHGDTLDQEILENECPYLEGVVMEAMRLKPIASGALRRLKTTQTMDGFQIPRGWSFFWNILLTHVQDPVTFQQDGSHMDIRTGFVSERWLDKSTRPLEDFVPMGGGPRYCLGSHLAYTEMKVFLAVLARKIDFQLVQSPEEELVIKRMSIMPTPADGVPVTATAR
jgi:cytochrome P450